MCVWDAHHTSYITHHLSSIHFHLQCSLWRRFPTHPFIFTEDGTAIFAECPTSRLSDGRSFLEKFPLSVFSDLLTSMTPNELANTAISGMNDGTRNLKEFEPRMCRLRRSVKSTLRGRGVFYVSLDYLMKASRGCDVPLPVSVCCRLFSLCVRFNLLEESECCDSKNKVVSDFQFLFQFFAHATESSTFDMIDTMTSLSEHSPHPYSLLLFLITFLLCLSDTLLPKEVQHQIASAFLDMQKDGVTLSAKYLANIPLSHFNVLRHLILFLKGK